LVNIIISNPNKKMVKSMTAKSTVERYLGAFFGKQIDYQTIRELLADDFDFQGPLMSANSADEFIQKLKGYGENVGMQADIHLILDNNDTVVARYDFILPSGRVPATEWYIVKDKQIKEMHLICDPRPFFEQTG
jgi:hypothetical protein